MDLFFELHSYRIFKKTAKGARVSTDKLASDQILFFFFLSEWRTEKNNLHLHYFLLSLLVVDYVS